MIDLHTHILPQIDDGSGSPEESCAILGMLKEQGVDEVVFTPHYYGLRHGVDSFLERRAGAYDRLKIAYNGDMKIYLGAECNIAKCTNSNFDDLIPLAINGTKYILAELSFESEWDGFMWGRIDRLLQTGLVPVIAHVELYPPIRKNPSYVSQLISLGCAVQVNCDSVVADDPLVKAIISHGQAHCLGSDTHNTTTRPPKYEKAAKKISEEFGAETLNGMEENMRRILGDERVYLNAGEPIKRTFLGKYK